MITVHCGLHKTGSSSIQVALPLVVSTARRAIVTPDPRDDRSERGWARRLRGLTAAPDAIFSDENLLGDPDDAYRASPDRVALLRDSLAGSSFQLVVYLRPQVDWLGSVYLQGVQEGRTTSPEDFLAGVTSRRFLAWSNLITLLREQSGAERVVVRAHARSRDAVEDFFRTCGLGTPPKVSRTTIRENVSIAALQAPILVAINQEAGRTRDDRVSLRHAFQGMLAAADPAPLSPFPEDLQREVAERFRADWLKVADMIEAADPAEAAVFREESVKWDETARQFPGASVTDPLIAAELLRCFMVMVGEVGIPPSPGRWERAWAKLRENPRDVPRAIRRSLRRSP